MSDFSNVDPVISGAGYAVQSVNGRKPVDLADFVTDPTVTFIAVHGSQTTRVCGSARRDGDIVIVHEKTAEGVGKDVRTWAITPHGDTFDAHVRSIY